MNKLEVKMATWPRWKCPGCGTPMMDPSPRAVGNPCEECFQKQRASEQPSSTLLLSDNRLRILQRCGVPDELARKQWVEPAVWPSDPRPGFNTVSLATWAGRPPFLLLQNQKSGTGKTMMSLELLVRLVRGGRTGAYVIAAEIPGRMYGQDSATEINFLCTVGALVVDELGRGHEGKAWDPVGYVVDSRWRSGYPTIVNTNRELPDIQKGDGAPVFSRLKDGLLISVGDVDRRGVWNGVE